MGIYGYMKPYIHAFDHIYIFYYYVWKIRVAYHSFLGCTLCASLNIIIYIYIWAIYTLYKPCIHIYRHHIYVFCLYFAFFIHYDSCIYHFRHAERCYLISLFPVMRRVTLKSMQKKDLNTKFQGRSGPATWLTHFFWHCLRCYHLYI